MLRIAKHELLFMYLYQISICIKILFVPNICIKICISAKLREIENVKYSFDIFIVIVYYIIVLLIFLLYK